MLPVDEFDAKVRRIATALFYRVLDDPEPSRWDLRNDAGDEGFSIRNSDHLKRIVIRGYYPSDFRGRHHLSGRDEAPEITVSETKTAEAVVADIKRRFLPSYLETLTKVRERNKEAKETFEAREGAINRLAAAIGEHHRSSHSDNAVIYFMKGGMAEVFYKGEEIALKVTVSLPVAVRILTLIRQDRNRTA